MEFRTEERNSLSEVYDNDGAVGVGVDEMIFVMVEVLVVVGFTAWQNSGRNSHNEEYMNIENDKS